MSLQIGDNFSFKGKKPLDSRLVVNNLTTLKSYKDTEIYNGIRVYVESEKNFYTYDYSNTDDSVTGKWRTDKFESIDVKNAVIDKNESSSTYGHLLITLSDGTNKDCGYILPQDGIKGDKGDPGEDGKGFAIVRIYTNTDEMVNDENPVLNGEMIAVIYNNEDRSLVAKIFIRNDNQIEDDVNFLGYTFFCNLDDATVIQGPEGKQGKQGEKGEDGKNGSDGKPCTVTTTPLSNGHKVTFTYYENTVNDDGTISSVKKTKDFNLYNGSDGKSITNIDKDEENNQLVITMSDSTGYSIDLPKFESSTSKSEVIIGLYDDFPAKFNEGDKFYHTVDEKIYTAESSTTFDKGEIPQENTIYVCKEDKKLYAYVDGIFSSYGGSDPTPGEKGDKGDTGDSAYESAKKLGYEGTEEEWLKSLKGMPSINPVNKHWMLGEEDTGIRSQIDPLDYTNNVDGLEDTPVGHIISFMGTKAPNHYLICDGTVYNISDYTLLADHIKENFGSYNYFGGNGTTTFAVPDLRGEFLRGSGTNGHTGEGDGGEVGEHQTATDHPYTMTYSSGHFYTKRAASGASMAASNVDKYYGENNAISQDFSAGPYRDNFSYVSYKARPTNTSVNFCIKCEPTYFINMLGINIENELCDWHTVNPDVATNVLDVKLSKPITEYDTLIFYSKCLSLNKSCNIMKTEIDTTEININPYLSSHDDNWEAVNDSYFKIPVVLNLYICSFGGAFISNDTFRISQINLPEGQNITNMQVKIKGIKKAHKYTDVNGNIINDNCDCGKLTDQEILDAVDDTISELNKKEG